ncbi:MAG: EAL domain-containing protein, partial [Gammaproteobacteria bacterium]|nr:EAL domain-containing protein [Gammaproteobacteria bacterium]
DATGVRPETLIGTQRTPYIGIDKPDSEIEKWNHHIEDLKSHLPFRNFEFRFKAGDSYRYVRISGTPRFDSDGKFQGYRGTGSDITQSKMAELEIIETKAALEEQSTRLQGIVDNVSNGIVTIDELGIVESFNPTAQKMFGYSAVEVIGENVSILMPEPDSGQHDVYLQNYLRTGEAKISGIGPREVTALHKNGKPFPVELRVSEMYIGDRRHFVGVLADITARKRSEEKLRYQASHDDLTRLINRSEFERRAGRLLSTTQQDKSQHALCFMDIDQFKIVNDTCGHVAGDELLRRLSQLLQTVVRHRDTLARLGGDEFGVLIEHCSLEQAQRVAEALRQNIEKFQFSWEGQPFRIGVSIGLVEINETTTNLTELLKQADAACYMAKDLGRNRIHTYFPEDVELARRLGQMHWVSGINQALEEDRFCLYAQAIMPLGGGTDQHYELLLRMLNERGEIIPPSAFLPAAERYDLISLIDAWVVRNALKLLADNPEFLQRVHFITINLSGPSMSSEEFLEAVYSQIKAAGIDPGKICFEVTETAAISNLSAAVTFIKTLKKIGCYFALDDFGSGLSSFGYLKQLPVDYLKIDGMFVKDMVENPIDHAMVKSINDIGQVMGMKTIAEFVENDQIIEKLGEIGVNYVQGYGVEKPRPFVELLGSSKESNNS